MLGSLLLLAVALLGAGPGADPYELVRRGNAAYAEGHYEAALRFYEQAGSQITDPGLAAFNQAAAHYQLEQYREAERHYRYCLEDAAGPRRARALFGLGNSLLQQRDARGAEVLEQAIGAYAECLREEKLDAELADGARHNLELAKLLLAQLPPKKEPSPPDSGQPKNGSNRKTRPEDDPRLAHSQSGAERPDPRSPGKAVKPDDGPKPIPTNERAPGQGTLPPVPDKGELVRMAPEDAARHLDLAVSRIAEDRRTYRYRAARAPGSGVLDW
jgi:tetratricopeptide (TPR) repeat protein